LIREAAVGEAEDKMDEEIGKADKEVETDKEQGSTKAGHTRASCTEGN
jgi:hypothetical protein